MIRPGLTLAAMKMAAQSPEGRAEIRRSRKSLQDLRDKIDREHKARLQQADEVLRNMAIALGEIEA